MQPGMTADAYGASVRGTAAATAHRRTAAVYITDIRVEVQPNASGTPLISGANVLHSATLLAGTIAPGEMVTIVGIGTLNGGAPISVTFNGIPDRILTCRHPSTQCRCPVRLGHRLCDTTVHYHRWSGKAVSVVVPVAPLRRDFSCKRQREPVLGSILNDDSTLNSPENPARRSSTVGIYAHGVGTNRAGRVRRGITTDALVSRVRTGHLPNR
jgi:uncharacterized protein (TIGR03437 family)